MTLRLAALVSAVLLPAVALAASAPVNTAVDMPLSDAGGAPAPPAAPPEKTTNPMGYLEVLIASVFFGSNFVPVKRYETHDGMYYQWVMCAAIWMTGLFVQLLVFSAPSLLGDPDAIGASDKWAQMDEHDRIITGRPDPYSVKFIPVAALGGFLWATGNTLSVPVINMIGLSLGLLIWGSANMLMGWATGMFGLVTGGKGDQLAHPTLNYVGVALAVIALGMYTQIKASEQTKPLNAEPGSDVLLDDVFSSQVHAPCHLTL